MVIFPTLLILLILICLLGMKRLNRTCLIVLVIMAGGVIASCWGRESYEVNNTLNPDCMLSNNSYCAENIQTDPILKIYNDPNNGNTYLQMNHEIAPYNGKSVSPTVAPINNGAYGIFSYNNYDASTCDPELLSKSRQPWVGTGSLVLGGTGQLWDYERFYYAVDPFDTKVKIYTDPQRTKLSQVMSRC